MLKKEKKKEIIAMKTDSNRGSKKKQLKRYEIFERERRDRQIEENRIKKET